MTAKGKLYRETLRYVVDIAADVVRYEEENKMTSSNVGIVFGSVAPRIYILLQESSLLCLCSHTIVPVTLCVFCRPNVIRAANNDVAGAALAVKLTNNFFAALVESRLEENP